MAQSASPDGIAELLAEHSRVMDEKTRMRQGGETPPTRINYELTRLVNQIVERAKEEKSEAVRSLLTEEAARGHFGAEGALEWLTEADPWWAGRSG